MIRRAKKTDIHALASLIHNAWQKDLIELVSPSVTSLFTIDWFASKLQKDLERESVFSKVFERDGSIAGYAAGRYSEEDDVAELMGLYVCPSAQNQGIGSALIQDAKSYFGDKNKNAMIVWTLLGAKNNAFYNRHNPVRKKERDITISKLSYRGIGYVYGLDEPSSLL
ncbi:GNAT family N-acetyltransferase [Vibrio sp. SCSIO 43132]|uniref:GNAT family N-acetyltransferase n=1 Tax=Vibrio sp. SCSIO 43132 TaxID=2779363 RepID=UPI001CA8C7A2|nr:GNAT family N-acetyltransferase [Vibrio sp. SCSIO 43132]UAB73487.1 GNAT family N-acetyltransferase [Vibrio sp. SCSIO 43132]